MRYFCRKWTMSIPWIIALFLQKECVVASKTENWDAAFPTGSNDGTLTMKMRGGSTTRSSFRGTTNANKKRGLFRRPTTNKTKTSKQVTTTTTSRRRQQQQQQQQEKIQNTSQSLSSPSESKTKRNFPLSEYKEALGGVLLLTIIERGIHKIFVGQSIQFPAQLAGCIGLFAALALADTFRPGLGGTIYTRFVPGCNLLSKWFPVLFVPGLVMLPLAPSIGNGMEIFKLISVAVLGLVYSLLTNAYTILFFRKALGQVDPPLPSPVNKRKGGQNKNIGLVSVALPATPAIPKAYRDETMSFLFKATIISGIISILATNAGNEFATPVRTIFFFFTTFASYVWGARLPLSITKIIHPLILSAMITLSVIRGTSVATSESFLSVLNTYKVGTYDLSQCGAADIMMFLLGPSVVSYAISMYDRRQLLKDNLVMVLLSMLVSSIGGLFGTAAFVRLIALGGKYGGGTIRLSTLARNVTTALAIACTNVLQGDVSLAVLIVVMTGVLGATYGRTILDALNIHDPITRGLAVGGAAQGLGVTSMMPESDAFPFAAISMILTAISATVLVSIPPIQQALVSLCQGNL